MHVELVETFRCVAPHRDSWLVAAAHHTEGRIIVEGVLGCPVCDAEYVIVSGVARFDSLASRATERPRARPPAVPTHMPDKSHEDEDSNAALRLAAMLGASDAAMTVALVGVSLQLATAVQSIAPVRCIVVDATDEGDALEALRRAHSQLAIVRGDGALPVARGALHGVYAGHGSPSVYARALRVGGRLVALADSPVPAGIVEIARDETHWVGERSPETAAAPASLVQLHRRR